MGKQQLVWEVTQPFHKSGTEVLYQPGDQFPYDEDPPEGVMVRAVAADVPDAPAPKAAAKTADKPAGKQQRSS